MSRPTEWGPWTPLFEAGRPPAGFSYLDWLWEIGKGAAIEIDPARMVFRVQQEPADDPKNVEPTDRDALIIEMKAVSEGDVVLTAADYDALMLRLAEELSSVRPA